MRTGDVWELTCHACGTTHREAPAGAPSHDTVVCGCGARLNIEWRPIADDANARKLTPAHVRLATAAVAVRAMLREVAGAVVDPAIQARLAGAADALTMALKNRTDEPRQRQR